MSVVATAERAARVSVRTADRFYVGMAVACLAVAVAGFMPTYWIPMLNGTLDVPPIAHVHAVLFYGWTLLFVKQTSLVAAGRVTRHREMGVLGVALASGMLCIGLATAVVSLKRSLDAGLGDPAREFMVIPVTGILMFAGFFTVALLNVRKPEVHKRLLLGATVGMLQAAVGRMFSLFAPPPPEGVVALRLPSVAVSIPAGLVADLLIVAAMVHDWRTRGRVHAAYWVGLAVVVAVQVLRVPLAATSFWYAVTDWFLSFIP